MGVNMKKNILHAGGIIACGMAFFLFVAGTGRPSFARMVTDQAGRTVDVPDEPRRVAALAPSITEIVYALGREDRLVGATRFSDYPPAARKLPKVGSYVHLDLEKIAALAPDLCIAVKDGNPVAVVNRLTDLDIPVFAVDPRSLDTVMRTITDIGGLLNASAAAGQIATDMRRRIETVEAAVSKDRFRPGVFFQIGVDPIVAVGDATFIHELIVTAGGRNLSEGPTPYPRFSEEQVLALKPDILIITSMARGETFERVKRKWERWPEMPAVKNRRIHIVDSNVFDRPGPRMTDGLERLFNIFHTDAAPGP